MPGYTWKCILSFTKCELETVQDVVILLFKHHCIREGISLCCTRNAKANNEYLSNYVPGKHTSYILYLDVNNLYGWVVCGSSPYGDLVVKKF